MALTGNETLFVLGQDATGRPAATTEQTTTGAIAALAATEGAPFVVTTITTVGNGVLTAAGLVGGEIVRTGPVAAFSDATAAASAIIAALPAAIVNSSFNILVKNATAFTQTITAGANVTLPATVIIPAFSVANYVGTVATATTVSFIHIDTTPISVGANTTAPSITAINTVGAGLLTAASFVGGLIQRTGSQSGTPFSDVTDTASAIVAASANLVNKVGTSMLVEIANSTNAIQTITGGASVTVSGVSVIPPNTISQFLLTYTAATPTVSLVGLGITQNLASQVNLLGTTSGFTAIAAQAIAGNNTVQTPNVSDILLAGQQAVTTATFNSFQATTVVPVPGLAVTLTTSGTYAIQGQLQGTSINAGGLKATLTAPGSLTLTSANITGYTYSGTVLAFNTPITGLTQDFAGITNTYTNVIFNGTLVVNQGGVLNVSASQHTSASTSTTIGAGSYLLVTRGPT